MATDKLLTKEEIDALMEDVTKGNPGLAPLLEMAEEISPYQLFSQENAITLISPALETIYERLAHRLRIALTDLLRREVSVEAGLMEARSYSDFIASLSPPCSVNVINIAPLSGPGLLVLQQQLVFVLVDVFFGGKGCQYGLPGSRDFTPIENRLIQRLRDLVFRSLETAWQPFVAVQCSYLSAENNPQFVTAINPAEVLALVSLQISMDDVTGTLYLALPCSMFEPIRADLLTDSRKEPPHPSKHLTRLLEEGVKGSQVMVRGLLAQTELTLGELLSIKVGDFIPIDIPRQAILETEGVALYAGQYGVAQGQRALRIEQALITNQTTNREGVTP